MARGVNKVILIGNLGKDVEIRHMPNGNAVASFSIATSETWKDKQSGEKQEKTEWHNIVFFGRMAEVAGEYLRKGSKVYIEGSLTTDKWTDKDGNDRYTTKIKGRDLQMLDSSTGGQGQRPNQNSQGGGQQNNQGGGQQQAQSSAAVDDFDDDIPF